MLTTELIESLRPADWERLEQTEPGYQWDVAWEAALEAGAGPRAAQAQIAARRAGAGPRAAALVAAAVAAATTPGLDAEQERHLLLPLAELLPVRSRSSRWSALAAAAVLGGAGGR
jgi:hypothetical protein